MNSLRYAVVTPARNEAPNLERLGVSLARQTLEPLVWIIVDNGSTDETLEIACRLADAHDWAQVITAPGDAKPVRGAAVVRAFHAGLAHVPEQVDVVVKLDADVSVGPDHFEALLAAFADDASLGIASGACAEFIDGRWQTLHVTRGGAWGAARAYRATCLRDVLPLEERMGWDGIDEFKAQVRGWRTATIPGLVFQHHRKEGERDGRSLRRWAAAGASMHYMGYRFSYLVLRTLFRARKDPSAVAMVAAYAWEAMRGRPRCADTEAVRYLRERQRLRELPRRSREAAGGA